MKTIKEEERKRKRAAYPVIGDLVMHPARLEKDVGIVVFVNNFCNNINEVDVLWAEGIQTTGNLFVSLLTIINDQN